MREQEKHAAAFRLQRSDEGERRRGTVLLWRGRVLSAVGLRLPLTPCHRPRADASEPLFLPAFSQRRGRIGQGRSAGLVSALGIGVGTLFHVAAAVLGLSALVMSSVSAFSAVKYLGAAYLVFLGVQKLRHEESFEPSRAAAPERPSRVFCQGVVVNVLNPKTVLFFFAFLPQFVDRSRGNAAQQILFLGTLFAIMGVASDSVWALFAGAIAEHLKRNTRWRAAQRYVSGGMLISLGLVTAVSGTGKGK
jgi:threonine/homoserine/homoserine lactone efflux protein